MSLFFFEDFLLKNILENLFLPDYLKETLIKISESSAPLLIMGESGVGKEMVAKTVHYLSSRKNREPIIINSAAIPSDLLEKELFGAVSGAFTGSDKDSVGKFKQADGSTLILDEVGDLPYEVQGKLLKAIESGIIQPVGSNDILKVNCRIIGVTNKNLLEMVNKGQFREDLYYRLNVLSFAVPPLRDRLTKIKEIINYYISELSTKDVKYHLTDECYDLMLAYNWPGNIRELKNNLERAAVISNNEEITSDYLLLSSDINVNISHESLKEAVTQFKKRYITQVLESNGWNITKTSKVLDIQRTYLSRLIKQLNIS